MAGYITTTSDVRNTLQEGNRDIFGNRTWSNMYSSVDIAKQQAQSQLSRQFGEDVGTAYAAAQQQRSSILGSNLGAGYKESLLKSTDDALVQAYNTYLSNLRSGEQSVTSQAQQSYSAIDKALTTEAQNVAAYQQAHFDYYDYLVENYSEQLLQDRMWSGYTVPVQAVDEDGNLKYDEQGNKIYQEDDAGNTVYRMKTRQELLNTNFDEVDGRKEWKGLFDAEGNLTIRGADFFDLMQNYFAGRSENIESFDQWLMENNEELLDWASSYNPYDYTEAGTHAGSFKTMVGLTSTDYTYEFAERFGGLTTGEVKNLYSDFTADVEKFMTIGSEDAKNKGKEFTNLVHTSTKNLANVASQLGIKESEFGENFSWDTLEKNLDLLYNGTASEAEMAGQWFNTWSSTIAADVIAGTGIGATIGGIGGAIAGTGLLPGVGTAGGAITGAASGAVAGAGLGAVIGTFHGAIQASINTDKQRNYNKQAFEQSKELYAEAVNMMINYSLQKKRQAEIEFYNNK